MVDPSPTTTIAASGSWATVRARSRCACCQAAPWLPREVVTRRLPSQRAARSCAALEDLPSLEGLPRFDGRVLARAMCRSRIRPAPTSSKAQDDNDAGEQEDGSGYGDHRWTRSVAFCGELRDRGRLLV